MQHSTSHPLRRTAAIAIVAATAGWSLAGCGEEEAGEPVLAVDEPATPGSGQAADAAAESSADESTDERYVRPPYGVVTAAQAAELVADGVSVIDVRTPEEYDEGHIEGAQLIDFSSDTFADEIATLDPDQEYLVYCRSGNRSAQAIVAMREIGVGRTWDLDGGVIEFTAGGWPLIR